LPTLLSCYAKTRSTKEGTSLGLSIEDHSIVVGLIARELIARYPKRVRELLFPKGTELVAAIHDVGKINPHFQEKIRRSLPYYTPNEEPMLINANPQIERAHAEVSQATLQGTSAPYIAEIAGMHHGSAPGSLILLPDDKIIGGPNWQKIRIELVDKLKTKLECNWPQINSLPQTLAIAGLTTVSDWIGSGRYFETLDSITKEDLDYLVKAAIDAAGFVKPKVKKGLNFADIFPPYTPHDVQSLLFNNVDSPGVYILEASMGAGKTEAALFAAYKLIASGLANGIYFALPTKITSERIYERMSNYLHKILSEDDYHKLVLAHGTSWLVDLDMGEDARPGFPWFDFRKRRLLAPFAVGTIDQALLSVMNVRHGFVRAFALAGKVVILDEVHSYDFYTGTIMDRLIDSLVGLGAIVILLSATLTYSRKNTFFKKKNQPVKNFESEEYPLVTKFSNSKITTHSLHQRQTDKTVLTKITSAEDSIVALAKEKAVNGEYILWIENTVKEAQAVFKTFASWGASLGIDVGLIHSRYTLSHRNKNEAKWVHLFGKEGRKQTNAQGKILIGTQVLEQSLDLDADLLVTRIAPIDMILQRTGRLWRHNDSKRVPGAQCQVIILTPEITSIEENPEWAFGPSGLVYSPYILVRTFHTLQGLTKLEIPSDLRLLIEATYQERIENNFLLNKEKSKLIKTRQTLSNFALQSISFVGKSFSDEAPTRYSDLPTSEVILLKSSSDLSSGRLDFIDDSSIAIPKSFESDRKRRRELASLIAQQTISVPTHLAPLPLGYQELSPLKSVLFIAESQEERVRVALLAPSGRIEGFYGREANKEYRLEYSKLMGYSATKKEDK
jgi:CRISPR-associated endonuclease/helicase Cas3